MESNIQKPTEIHPWITHEAAGDEALLGQLCAREDLIDVMANKDTKDTVRDIAKNDLDNLYPQIIARKEQLGLETIPPLPPLKPGADSV